MQRPPSARRRATPAAALLLLGAVAAPSCDVVRVQRHELWVRHDRAADEIDALLLMTGVSAEPQRVSGATRSVGAVLDGRRQLGFQFLRSLRFDRESEDEPVDPHDRGLDDGVSVRSLAFLDHERRLGVVQRLRVEGAAAAMDRLNAWLREVVVDEYAPKLGSDDLDPDERERMRRWVEECERGWTFLAFDGPQLVIRVPASGADVATFLREVIEDANEGGGRAKAFVDLASVRVADGCASLVLGEPGQAAWRIVEEDLDEPYDHGLRDALSAGGRTLERRDVELLRREFLEE